MIKNKMPKTLDPIDVFNTSHKKMHEMYASAESIYYSFEFSSEEKLEVISCSCARASGIADMLRELGYEVRDSQGILVTQAVMNKFYALKHRAEMDVNNERKGA